jgi:hypothetical protein
VIIAGVLLLAGCGPSAKVKPTEVPSQDDEWPVVPGVRTPWAGRPGKPGAPLAAELGRNSIRVRWRGFWSSGEFVTYDNGVVHFPHCDAQGGWTLHRDAQEIAPAFAHLELALREGNGLSADLAKAHPTCRDATVTQVFYVHQSDESSWEWSSCDDHAPPMSLRPVLERVAVRNPCLGP